MTIHHYYDKLDGLSREAVDAAYNAASCALRTRNINIANDDRAERLVDAIARYVIDSKPRLADA